MDNIKNEEKAEVKPLKSRSEQRREFFRAFEVKSLRQRSILTQISDNLTETFGSPVFLLLNVLLFGFWILVNMGYFPGVDVFDPYPFGLLTMIVSLEAIFLSIIILVSQNRSSLVNSMREEVHLRVNLIAEEEITKILEILADMRKEMGIKKHDEQLQKMLEKIDTYNIEKSIADQISRANKPLSEQLIRDFPSLLTYPVRKPVEIIENLASGDKSSK